MHWQESAYLFVANVEHLRDNTEFVWNVEITTETSSCSGSGIIKSESKSILAFSCLKITYVFNFNIKTYLFVIFLYNMK